MVRARPTTTVSRARPEETRAKAAASPMASEMTHPAVASRSGSAPDPLQVELVAGQEDQEGQPEVGEAGDHAAQVGDAEHVRPHEDPEPDLDHDLGDGHSARSARTGWEPGPRPGRSAPAWPPRTSVTLPLPPSSPWNIGSL